MNSEMPHVRDRILAAIDDELGRMKTLDHIFDCLTSREKMQNALYLRVPSHCQTRFDECAHRLANTQLFVRQALDCLREDSVELLNCYRIPGEPGLAKMERISNSVLDSALEEFWLQLRQTEPAPTAPNTAPADTHDSPREILWWPSENGGQTNLVRGLLDRSHPSESTEPAGLSDATTPSRNQQNPPEKLSQILTPSDLELFS